MKILKAKIEDVKDITEIAVEGLIEDEFFSYYKNKGRKGKRQLYKMFFCAFCRLTDIGIMRKIVEGNKTVGVVSGFYFNRIKEYDKSTYELFFPNNNRINTEKLLKIEKKLIELSEFDLNCIYLCFIAIKKEYRNKGFAKKAVDEFIKEFKDEKIIVESSNSIMMNILEKLGFVNCAKHEKTVFFKRFNQTEQKKEKAFSDIITFIPSVYNFNFFEKIKREKSVEKTGEIANKYLSELNKNTHIEYHKNGKTQNRNENIAERVKRILLEETEAFFHKEKITATICLSVDMLSNSAVVEIIFKEIEKDIILNLLDSISSEDINLKNEMNEFENIYNYLWRKYKVRKSGTEKNLVTIAKERDNIDDNFLAAILMSETDDGLGEIVDRDVCDMLCLKNGLSQYSYADVFMSEKIVLQLSSTFDLPIKKRIEKETIAANLIEMVCLEESAIVYANKEIKECLTFINEKSANRILRRYCKILNEYAATIEFWDIQTKYLSTRKSINNIRKHFKIDETLKRYDRDLTTYQKIFNTRTSIIDNTESSLLTTIGAILTTISIIDLIFKFTGYIKLSIAAFIVGILLLVKNKFLINKKNNKKK